MINNTDSYPMSYDQPDNNTSQSITAGNRIYYIQNKNIFEYDILGKTSKQLTFNNQEDFNSPLIVIKDINVLNTDKIGYSMCKIITGDYGCGIYILELDTLKSSKIIEIPKDSNLLNTGFYSENKFAYLVTINSDSNTHLGQYKLIYVEHYKETTLQDISFTAYGRDGSPEDSQKIIFSKNGQYFF